MLPNKTWLVGKMGMDSWYSGDRMREKTRGIQWSRMVKQKKSVSGFKQTTSPQQLITSPLSLQPVYHNRTVPPQTSSRGKLTP